MYNTNFDGSEKIRIRKKEGKIMEMREKKEEMVGYFFKLQFRRLVR